MAEILGVSDAAKILGVTPDRVRQLERNGQLPAQKTPGGVRVFLRDDVYRLADRRVCKQEGTRYAER